MPDKKYLDFDLVISSDESSNGGRRYFAKVESSPAGPTRDRVLLRPIFPGQSSTELLLRLENAVLRARGQRRGGPASREAKLLQDFGSEVFNAVFRDSPQIATQYMRSITLAQEGRAHGEVEGLRIKLRIEPPELAQLPWEYLYDDSNKQHLCLQNRSPLVRYLDVPEPTAALEVKGPVNVLGMIANPGGEWELLDTENERRRIDEAIAPLEAEGRVNFRWVPGGTSEHLMDMMQQASWHVFHFIGHGGVRPPAPDSPSDPPEGFIVFGDGQGGAEELSASHLSLLLGEAGSLRLAVLNCCESGRGDGTNVFSSPGAALVNSGVPAVVAMQFPISDEAAIRFANRFYRSLVNNQPLEAAITAARVSMYLKSDIEWGIPVLFTRSETGRLFSLDVREVPPDSAPPAEPTVRKPPDSAQQAARAELRRLFAV